MIHPRDKIGTRDAFDRDLRQLQDDFLRMGRLVDAAVQRAIDALQARSVEQAEAVIAADNVIDAVHLELENRCLRLIATQQPMAKDLRMIAAVWAMTIDLERMGDHAEDIAKVTRRMAGEPLLKPLVDIPRMAELARGMLRDGLDAFVRADSAQAERMAQDDDKVDHLYAQVFMELLTHMIDDPQNIQRAIALLMVAQALERAADHATNLAERVIYMITGTLKELNA
jgi:phosphate transport system protein